MTTDAIRYSFKFLGNLETSGLVRIFNYLYDKSLEYPEDHFPQVSTISRMLIKRMGNPSDAQEILEGYRTLKVVMENSARDEDYKKAERCKHLMHHYNQHILG
jgi:hypothetical protein